MDVLDYKEESYLGYVKADTEGWLAEQEALEKAAEGNTVNTQPKDSVFTTITGLFSKGLDLGIQMTRPTAPASVPVDTTPEESKIMGMPKGVFYGGLAVVGLITTVIVVKKMKRAGK